MDAQDFTDPALRGLTLRLDDLSAAARDDWRPDLLAEIDDGWLDPTVRRVRELLEDIGRLSDAQVETELDAVRRQLREGRLAIELREHSLALQEADARQPRGPAALGHRVSAIPARFRVPAGE
jgi:hypothetical protein